MLTSTRTTPGTVRRTTMVPCTGGSFARRCRVRKARFPSARRPTSRFASLEGEAADAASLTATNRVTVRAAPAGRVAPVVVAGVPCARRAGLQVVSLRDSAVVAHARVPGRDRGPQAIVPGD